MNTIDMSVGQKQGIILSILISVCLVFCWLQTSFKGTSAKIYQIRFVTEHQLTAMENDESDFKINIHLYTTDYDHILAAQRNKSSFELRINNAVSEVRNAIEEENNFLFSSGKKVDRTTVEKNRNNLKSKHTWLLKQLSEIQNELDFWSNLTTVIFICIFILLTFVSYRLYDKGLKGPISEVERILESLAIGDLIKITVAHHNEFARIYKTVNTIIENQISLASFAERIGDGNFQVQYQKLSEKDKIGTALLSMCDKLQKVSAEERRRNWANEGFALFGEILRNENNEKALSDKLLVAMVNYMKANQGSIFIISETSEKSYLNLISTYAWDRMRHEKREIDLGEGIIGQVALEGESVYLTDIPENFIRITSGLGDANPSSVLIVPLRNNENILGVMEFAFFRNLDKYEVEFVEKVAGSIATSLTSVKTNQRTLKLLEESRKLTEEMKFQEVELIKQAEELRAKEETQLRSMQELEAIKGSLSERLDEAKTEMKQQMKVLETEKLKNEGILEGCVDGVITFDKKGNIEFFNKASEEIFGYKKLEILGGNITKLIDIVLQESSGDYYAYYIENNNSKKEISVRTEISVKSKASGEVPVLITLSKTVIEGEFYFTVFIQSIAVELF